MSDERSAVAVGYRLFDFSGDVGVEATAPLPEQALVELGRGLSHVLTDGSPVRPLKAQDVSLDPGPDWTATAVAFLNELIFLFDTEQFLVADGILRIVLDGHGRRRITGTLRGETFDRERHRSGRGVKAATFHDAAYVQERGIHRFRIVLDL